MKVLLKCFVWLGVMWLYGVLCADITPDTFKIPLHISSPANDSSETHVFVGVPLPKGWFTDAGVVDVVDEQGTRVASSSWVMGKWPETEYVRWLGVEFIGHPNQRYFLVPSETGTASAPDTIVVTESTDGYVVSTGAARFVLPEKGALIREIWVNDQLGSANGKEELRLRNESGDDLYVVDQTGRRGIIGLDHEEGQLVYESGEESGRLGPLLRAVFRREGWYVTAAGEKLARHITRMHFVAGSAKVKVEHSLILTQDTNKVWFRDYGWKLSYPEVQKSLQVVVPDGEGREASLRRLVLAAGEQSVHLFQQKAFSFSRMDVDRDCYYEIGVTGADGNVRIESSGSLAGNWVYAIGNGHAGIGVSVRNFWQTYPKEIQVSDTDTTIHLWSSRAGEEMDFRLEKVIARWPEDWAATAEGALMNRFKRLNTNAAGMARSHDIVLWFGDADGETQMAEYADDVQHPVVCLVSPDWLRFTEAMGRFHPYDSARFAIYEEFMEEWFNQYMKVIRDWGDYGFFEFGNWPHVWYKRHKDSAGEERWRPYIDRYSGSMDYGFHTHLWRMFARSGDRKYYDAAVETNGHRLDMVMAHWDDLGSDAPIGARIPRRLRGTYTFSNSPVAWAGGSGFHHNSGTDIRTLAWWYYLSDKRLAREMLNHYSTAAKRVWYSGNRGPFRGTRPFASLKNLATVYQETGDPALREIVEEQLKFVVDTEAPQGVSLKAETTRLGKYGVKVGALYRVYEVMQHPLAAEGLWRGALTNAATSTGDIPLSYYNNAGEQLSFGALYDGDPIFFRALRRNMEVAVSAYKNGLTGEWEPMWSGGIPSLAGNPYPLGGMAYAMDAWVHSGLSEEQLENELTPYARQAGASRAVWVLFHKPVGMEITLDVRSGKELSPVVYDQKGKRVAEVKLEPFTDQLFSLSKGATRWLVTLPASLPEGVYAIQSGAGYAGWEVTWSNAPKLVVYAPNGILSGPGDRQWGNRIMPGSHDYRAMSYFYVPEGVTEFELYSSGYCKLIAPDGQEVMLGQQGSEWHKVSVEKGNRGQLWAFVCPTVSYIEFRGIPPVIAYGNAKRYFQPVLGEWLRDTVLEPSVELPRSVKGLFLDGKNGVEISQELAKQLIKNESGTLEFWLKPDWSSVYQFLQHSKTRALLQGGGWEFLLHRYGEMSATAIVTSDNGRKLETNAEAVLEEGKWYHFAIQWSQSDGALTLELYVNGRKQTFGVSHAGMVAKEANFTLTVPGDIRLGGNVRAAPNAAIYGLRFSNITRYQKDFHPQQTATTKADSHTTGLFLLDGSLEGICGQSGRPCSLRFVKP